VAGIDSGQFQVCTDPRRSGARPSGTTLAESVGCDWLAAHRGGSANGQTDQRQDHPDAERHRWAQVRVAVYGRGVALVMTGWRGTTVPTFEAAPSW